MSNHVSRRWHWRVIGVCTLTTLTLIVSMGMGLVGGVRAQRTTPHSAVQAAVQYPRYYDGNMTQSIDNTVHPEDPPNTYRVDTHYDACEQFKADPSVRSSLSDADLVADGLLPRNAFATPADWERSVSSAKTRVCDSHALYWVGTGAPVFINNMPSANVQRPQDPPNSDCFCIKQESQPIYAGWVADGQDNGIQHVAQYAYSWVPTLVMGANYPPDVQSDSIWVGGSGLFYGGSEALMQTGIQDWWYQNGEQGDTLFWECVNPQNPNVAPCNGSQEWGNTHIGDEITMYTSGNYYWEEDDTQHAVSTNNMGPVPLLDSSEWITEDPNTGCCGSYPLADFGNSGMASMHWMDQNQKWWDAMHGDEDYLSFTMAVPPDDPPTHILAYPGTPNPTYIDAYWGWGLSVFFEQRY